MRGPEFKPTGPAGTGPGSVTDFSKEEKEKINKEINKWATDFPAAGGYERDLSK